MSDDFRKKNLKINPLYRVWVNMRWRCKGKNNRAHRYVERGIKVCESWHDFDNFRNDMVIGYSKGLSIDRIDNDGDYEPNNCRWATAKEQANNRSTNRFITIDGTTRSLAQWIEFFDLKPSTVAMRLHYGWDINKALGIRG